MAQEIAQALDRRMVDNFIEDRIRAFKRLQSDIHSSRWKQGGIIAEIRAELGHENGIVPLAEATGIAFEELRRLEDIHTYFEISDLDPDVPINIYHAIGTEYRRADAAWPGLSDMATVRPMHWVLDAVKEGWDEVELRGYITLWSGRNTAVPFINMVSAVEDGYEGLEKLHMPKALMQRPLVVVGREAGGYWGERVLSDEVFRADALMRLAFPLRDPLREAIKRLEKLVENVIRPDIERRANAPEPPEREHHDEAEAEGSQTFHIHLAVTIQPSQLPLACQVIQTAVSDVGGREIRVTVRE
ncbi:MAG TPA: hypothetical protein GX718_03290 [Brevibacterium sp.]|nr:hypothetical protein [Brevibacterium sp.]